jgi:calcineurin-like phosphoesterase family protein
MGKVFVISDLHLGHGGILSFNKQDGKRVRPFLNLHEMHDRIIEGWTSVVSPEDKVYVLGDVAFKMNQTIQGMLRDLPGKKRLVRGNHDLGKDSWYHGAGFSSLYGVRQIDGVWLTHVPMHPQSLSGRARGNIHGHLHANHVIADGYWDAARMYPNNAKSYRDLRYFNACVEPLDYVPRTIDSIVEERKWQDLHQ